MSIIKLEEVTKIFNMGRANQVCAVRDASLRITKGQFTVLKGPSGSGKTSLLGLIGCMNRPTSGKIMVHGRDVAKLPERFLTAVRRDIIGFIFQQFNLIPGLNVAENVMTPLYPTDLSYSSIRRRTDAILDRLDLSRRSHSPVQDLSGGEQQRVAIARSLINEPEIILADEPTAHLDTRLSEELLTILERLKREGKTIVVATHDPLIYEKPLVDSLIEMRDGCVTKAF